MNLRSTVARMQHFRQTSTLAANGSLLLRAESLCVQACVWHIAHSACTQQPHNFLKVLKRCAMSVHNYRLSTTADPRSKLDSYKSERGPQRGGGLVLRDAVWRSPPHPHPPTFSSSCVGLGTCREEELGSEFPWPDGRSAAGFRT